MIETDVAVAGAGIAENVEIGGQPDEIGGRSGAPYRPEPKGLLNARCRRASEHVLAERDRVRGPGALPHTRERLVLGSLKT